MINFMAILAAIILSILSAYFSIDGLSEIFSSNKEYIIAMGIGLEFAKVITAIWLHDNWNTCANFIKLYLSVALILLMGITSLGIFGYLSRSHINSQLKIESTYSTDISNIKNQLSLYNSKIKQINDDINRYNILIDNVSSRLISQGKPKDALIASKKERDEISKLQEIKKEYEDKILPLEQKLQFINTNQKKLEAEVGPIKYVAQLFTDNTSTETLERSVTWMIMLIMVVFDPLAIILLIAGTFTFTRKKIGRPKISKFQRFKRFTYNKSKVLNLSKFNFL